MENRLDACENRWLRRIIAIAYKRQDHKRDDQTEDTTATSVKQDQTDAIKMAWAYDTDEGRQTAQRCTPVVSNREKINRTTEQKTDGMY